MTVDVISQPDGRKVCPYDHHSQEFAQTYGELYKDLRQAGPVVWTDSHGGFWVVTEYELIRKALMDPQTFAMEPVEGVKECGPLIPTPDEIAGMSTAPGLFFFVDGPNHDTPRTALAPHYAKRRVAKMTERVTAHVDRVLDQVLPLGEFDIVDDLAMPVVAAVVCEQLGFELDDPAAIFRALPSAAHLDDEKTMSFADAIAYVGEVVRARREHPRDDVISALLEWNGGEFSDAEVAGMGMQIIFGALENPQALLAHCLVFLDQRDDLRALLRAQPDKIPDFVTEALRFFNVAMGVARTARHDTELGGVQIRRGDRVFLPLPAGNHDPAKFDRPDEFDVGRPAAQNLALGAGTHVCLGQFVVHSVLTEVLRSFLGRVESYSIDPDQVIRNADKSANDNFVKAPMRVVALREPSTVA